MNLNVCLMFAMLFYVHFVYIYIILSLFASSIAARCMKGRKILNFGPRHDKYHPMEAFMTSFVNTLSSTTSSTTPCVLQGSK